MKRPTRADYARMPARYKARTQAAAEALSEKWGRKVTAAEVFEMFVADCWDKFVADEKKRSGH